jgi:DNA-directed RNA polymerase subunit beta'|uniref:DNA-directed RNA polymerase subunit beta'' n=1 Tax=Asterionellopsis glacialis TaxID=33640 RepID=A0A023HAC1_9STRA|nr:RNA polymerase b''-subunit [Asterionellopsis glacialis]AGH28309.1 RNA polymerase b''-subunit [Asterionellopsis glacialis]
MKNYTYKNTLISKKELRQLLAWSFTNYDSMQACSLADELKYLGFKYASQAGISISIEDLKVPFIKNLMIEKANQEILNSEKIYLKGKLTDVERFQKIIDTWNFTSEALKEQVIYYFKNYDPLNSVYIMAFSGARGNLSQVRQLVGMRGLMSDPSGEIMKIPIKKNFREGLTITDYLMSGYGARKGIVDTALKTANSGYLTRRLIDVSQDILIREKDCLTTHSFFLSIKETDNLVYDKILGRILNKMIVDPATNKVIAKINTQITPNLIKIFKQKKIHEFYIRSPLTCNLYRAICQKCYGWDLSNENLVDVGEAVGILAGQSIGEPGTQLTMRTFHTGGIFTSEARQQIICPVNGIIKFSKGLKTVTLRTNRGEDVLVTKNSSSLIIIPDNNQEQLVQIEVLRNTILFPKNNQYIQKETVVGEVINTNKQVKTEIKPILSPTSGEIFIPNLKNKINLLNNNKLIWILSGQLYNSPINSFINFYPDYKLNKNSYIFRTKLINHYSGYIEFINKKKNLYEKIVHIVNNKYSLVHSKIQKLSTSTNDKNYILNFKNLKYLLTAKTKNSKVYLQISRNQQIGTKITSYFQTLTGGTCYYNRKNLDKLSNINARISYYGKTSTIKRQSRIQSYRTIIWLGEETHKVNCEQNILLIEQGDFISEDFEIIPGLFSKTSGIVFINQRSNIVQTISIKSGLVYEGKKFKKSAKKIYYPGEVIFSNIPITKPSFCEHIIGKNVDQLLVRPIELYEFPNSKSIKKIFGKTSSIESILNLENKATYLYKSNQRIRSTKNLNIILNILRLKTTNLLSKKISIELLNNRHNQTLNFRLNEKLSLNNYIPPHLKYKNIQSCFLVQKNQFIDKYTTLGYLEAVTSNSLEIVKLKIKHQESKQILLISNTDCLTIKNTKTIHKTSNDFIINSTNVNETGKIIIKNKKFITLQKGRPYFFPNCKNEDNLGKTNLQYKLMSPKRIRLRSKIERSISLNYYDMIKLSIKQQNNIKQFSTTKISLKSELSKLFLKKNGKLYSSLIPRFFKKFTLGNKSSKLKFNNILRPLETQDTFLRKMDRTLLIQSSDIVQNNIKEPMQSKFHLTLVKFLEYPFVKSAKSIGLYSITEDFFEQDVNSVFCKNSEFIEEGETIGLLNFEKEITGDIVQGLPRIEEILEARKKNITIKRIPTNQKRGLLVQKTTLDPNFEFRKLATPIKENEKINPHKLLKVYFNYYGLQKLFVCDRTEFVKSTRLLNNYEGSYKSFKKVQSFILNSVQSVYQSQGVTINDKHLEVIIKQMTTKVLITYEGDTPLLRREVIDLYHIQYINEIIKTKQKQFACYVPLLLGITKASLNNPSFISAASFQETTRVLTAAAIEGRIDWLRGLKENIIIGHLIPAGTGSPNYRNCFRKTLDETKKLKMDFENIQNVK